MNITNYRNPYVVADASGDARAQFIRKTYLHLALAIVAFVGVEAALLNAPFAKNLIGLMLGNQFSWLIVLAAFMAVSWIADRWAQSDMSQPIQYLGLGLFVVAEAVIFLPILYIAANYSSPEVIPMAAMITGGLFLGLTAIVVVTRKDFSFLRSILAIGGFVALGVIVASIIFGFNLGTLFAGIMVAFAGAAILYQTSNIFLHYRTDQHVAAALALFSSVALLFWYVLRIVMSMRR